MSTSDKGGCDALARPKLYGFVTDILRPWVRTLTIQQQGTLLCAIRGPDGEEKESATKPIVRAYRACVIVNAKALGFDDRFMGDGSGIPAPEDVRRFFGDWDARPFHWFTHLLHAVEIVAYEHQNEMHRNVWRSFYLEAVDRLHLAPETKDTMRARLSSNGTFRQTLEGCHVCGFDEVVPTPVTRCGNCLEPRPGARLA